MRASAIGKVGSQLRLWLAGAALGLCAASVSAYTLTLSPASQTVSQGAAVSVDMLLSDLGANGLGSFDFDLSFDPALLGFTSFVDGGALGFSLGLSLVQGLGQLTFSDFSLEDPAVLLAKQLSIQGDIVLLTLRFNALAAGTADLGLDNGTLSDVDGAIVAFNQTDARVVITPNLAVPTPGTGALLVAAGFAAALSRRRAQG